MASAAEAEQVPDVAAENLRTSGEIDDEAEPESLGALSSEQPESSEPFKDPVDLEECSLALSQFLRMDTVAQVSTGPCVPNSKYQFQMQCVILSY